MLVNYLVGKPQVVKKTTGNSRNGAIKIDQPMNTKNSIGKQTFQSMYINNTKAKVQTSQATAAAEMLKK